MKVKVLNVLQAIGGVVTVVGLVTGTKVSVSGLSVGYANNTVSISLFVIGLGMIALAIMLRMMEKR